MANRVDDVDLDESSVPGRMIWSQSRQIVARPYWHNGTRGPYLKLFSLFRGGWVHYFRDGSIDPDGHLAFCAGTMPPHVYADWLEERLSDVPAELLALLRERMGEEK